MSQKVAVFTVNAAHQVQDAARRVMGLSGSGVRNGPGGITIESDTVRRRRNATVKDRIIVRVSGNTRDGSNWRWTYNFTEVVKTAAGFGGWTDRSGGRTGTGTLRNLIEDQNLTSGQLGNGVTVANLGTLTPQPIPTGTRIEVWAEVVGSATEYWCQYENGVDGSCT